jgi:hypothetical protein
MRRTGAALANERVGDKRGTVLTNNNVEDKSLGRRTGAGVSEHRCQEAEVVNCATIDEWERCWCKREGGERTRDKRCRKGATWRANERVGTRRQIRSPTGKTKHNGRLWPKLLTDGRHCTANRSVSKLNGEGIGCACMTHGKYFLLM